MKIEIVMDKRWFIGESVRVTIEGDDKLVEEIYRVLREYAKENKLYVR